MRRPVRCSVAGLAAVLALTGCVSQVPGAPVAAASPPQPVVTTLTVQSAVEGLRAKGTDCGQVLITPAPIWQCYLKGTPGITYTVTLQAQPDGTVGRLLVIGGADDIGNVQLPKKQVDETIAAIVPLVLAEPQLSAVQSWIGTSKKVDDVVEGLELNYGQTAFGGGRFEMLLPGTEVPPKADPLRGRAIPVEVSAVQAFAMKLGMPCDSTALGSLTCRDSPVLFRYVSASPEKGGGLGLATFTMITADPAQAIAAFTDFAEVLSPDGGVATAEWIARRLGAEGRSSMAAPGVEFVMEVRRAAGIKPEYKILARPAVY